MNTYSPSARDLLNASDNPAVPLYLIGIDAAVDLLTEIDGANLMGLDYDLACRAVLSGLVARLKLDPMEPLGYLLQIANDPDAPFFGAAGVLELDGADAEMLAALDREENPNA